MANVVGTVGELNGTFYARNEAGELRELKTGDEVYEGETIVPDTANAVTDTVIIIPDNGTTSLSINSSSEQLLDSTLTNTSLEDKELSFNPETVDDGLRSQKFGGDDSDYTQENESNNQVGDFAELDGDRTDVNSDLRDASWPNSVDYVQMQDNDISASRTEDGSAFAQRDGAITDIVSDLRQAQWEEPEEEPIYDGDVDDEIVALEPEVPIAPIPTPEPVEPTEPEPEVPVEPTPEPEPVEPEPEIPVEPEPIEPEPIEPEPEPETPVTPTPPTPKTIIKIVAADKDGNPLKDGDGNYITVNQTPEGGSAYYVALAFSPNTTVFNDESKLAIQEGTVDFTFTDGTATTSTDPSAVEGTNDYKPQDTITSIALGGGSTNVVKIDALDDYIADNGEMLDVSIDNYTAPETPTAEYGETTISNDKVKTTITDNTGKPEGGTGEDAPLETNSEDVIVRLIALDASGNPILSGGNYTFVNDVVEGSAAQYKALAFDSSNSTFAENSELDTQLGSVTVSSADNDTQVSGTDATAGSDYTAKTTTTVALDTAFSVDTIDDYIKDDGETYKVNIDSYVEPTSGDKYENVTAEGTVTTTIKDNTSTDQTVEGVDGTDPVQIVLVAVNSSTTTIADITDSDGKLILDNDNITSEGGNLYYIPVAVIDGKPLETQEGTVTLTYGVDSDGATPDATTNTDYVNTKTSTNIGEVFSVKTKTDSNGEENENFTVTISDPTGTPFETPVVDDANKTVTSTIEDSVYVKITDNGSVIEGNDLTHTLQLVDKNGNALDVNIPTTGTGKLIATLTYATTDDLNSNDFVDGSHQYSKDSTITVEFFGTTNTATITNKTLDDFIADNNENYTLTITDFTQDSSNPYKVIGIDNQKTVTGQILDGVTLGTPTDAKVYEDGLNDGTDSDIDTAKSLGIVSNGDTYTLAFDKTMPVTTHTSGGKEVTYTFSNSDKTLTGKVDGEDIFTVELKDNGTYDFTLLKPMDHPNDGANDKNEFDIPFKFTVTSNGTTSTPQTFNGTVVDSIPVAIGQTVEVDEDSTTGVTIRLSDDDFLEGKITINNGDGNGNTVIIKDAKVDIFDPNDTTKKVGDLTNNGDGTLTFVPIAEYSNYNDNPSFTYIATDADGDTSAPATIEIKVNPITDAPGVTVNNVSAIEDATDNTKTTNEDVAATGNTKEGTNSIALGLTLPSLSGDQTDENNATTGDHPERNGYIELKFTNGVAVTGAILEKGTGDDLATIDSNNQTVKVVITTDDGSAVDYDYHHNSITLGKAGVTYLTKAEYEALQIIHAEDNDTDIKINIKTTSYEVDDSNIPLTGVDGVSDDATMTVAIRPVTDDISLIWDTETGGTISKTTNDSDTFTFSGSQDEGYYYNNPLDLDALLSNTSGFQTDTSGDLDGSEQRKYTIEDIPEGSVVTIGGQSATADSSGKAVINLNNTNEKVADHSDFSLKLPIDYAGIVNGKITLSVYDKGADSSDTVGETIEKVLYFKTLQVNPVADGIGTLNAGQATGLEDAGRANGNTTNGTDAGAITAPENGIDLSITATTQDTSGREKVTMTIDKIPDGGALYYSDDNGIITVDETGAVTGLTNSNTNVTVDATADGTFKVTIVDFDNDGDLKFIPPHNSKEDYSFDVSAFTVDSVDDIVTESTSAAKDTTISVDVTGVADIPIKDDFKELNSNGDAVESGKYSAVTTEDTDTDGTTPNDGAVVSFASLYSDTGLDSYDDSDIGTDDNSETLSVVITGLGSDFSVVAKDGGELSDAGISFNGLSGEAREWSFAVGDLDKVEILTSKNYSGSMEFTVKHITTEDDGNSKTDEKEVKVLVKPVAEATITTSTDVTEDEASLVNFSIVQENGESGETLDTLWIKKADIENVDFKLYTNSDATTELTESDANIEIDGEYYKLTGDAIGSVYIKYAQDIGTDNTTDNSFNIKYEVSDSFTANSEDFSDTKTVNTGVYSIPLLSVTDDITLDTSAGTNVSVGNIVYDDTDPKVTINEVGTFSINLNVTSDDKDDSENFTRFVIENVQRGITVNDANATMAISGNGTNIWFLDIPDQELTGGTSSYTVNFKVNESLRHYADTSTVKITAYANDDGSDADDIEEAVQTIEFINNLTDPEGTEPSPTIDVGLTLTDIVVTEDTPFVLNGIIDTILDNSTAPNNVIATDASVTYTLAFSNLNNVTFDRTDTYTDDNVNSYGGEHYITVTAAKSDIQADIETALSKVKMIPNEHYNENNASTQLSFGVKLTAYVGEGYARDTTEVKTLSVDVDPVTDDITSTVSQSHIDEAGAAIGSAQEDGTTTINITLDSVDKSPLGGGVDDAVYTIVQGAGDSTAASTVAITHTSGIYGKLEWDGGSHTFSSGSTVADVPIADISNGNLKFTPTQDASGSVTFSYTVYAQEIGATDISTTTNDFTISVNAVADGLNLLEPKGVGKEDTLIQIYADYDIDPAQATPLSGATEKDIDGSESILSMYINDVPEGFLIYIGEDGSQVLANKGDSDGSRDLGDGNGTVNTNEWGINISDGIPKVWIKASENWSSTTAVDLMLKTVVKDGTDTTIVEQPFSISVDSVADGFTSIQANPAVQTVSEDIAINLNAQAGDLDGSETGILTLSGFGADDVTFKQDGVDIMANVSYDGDTYTISNIDLSTEKLNKLTFEKAGLTDKEISFTFKTVESDSTEENPKISEEKTGSFTATTDNVITDTTVNGTDAVTDRLELTGTSFDFSNIESTSIEKIDLTTDTTALTNVTMNDVLQMTNDNNELMIIGDSGDSVALANTGGTWSKGENISYGGKEFETYTNGDATVKVSVDENSASIVTIA